jgi:hypothetical protein
MFKKWLLSPDGGVAGPPVTTPNGEVPSQAAAITPPAVQAQGTPSPSPSDALATGTEPKVATVTQEDLNKLKASLQSQHDRAVNAWKAKEEDYQRQLFQLKAASLPDDARAKFETEFKVEQLESRAAEYQRQLQESQAKQTYSQFFADMGVPASTLDNSSLDTLVESGWQGTKALIENLKSQLAAAKASPVTTPTPPDVITSKGPQGHTTVADLVRQYGSMENVYRLIETNQLDGNILLNLT